MVPRVGLREVRRMLENRTTTKTVLMTYDAKNGLEEVIQALGHDPRMVGVEPLEDVARRLCDAADHNGQARPEWGWRYLRNVLNGKLDASRKLTDAILRLGALLDGAAVEAVQGERVQVLALGKVAAGAVVLADSKRCGNPACRVEFVPRVPWQKCHSAECAKTVRKINHETLYRGQAHEKGKK
jgi:hypothetical protein